MSDTDPVGRASSRTKLEHATILDRICSSFASGDPVGILTESPDLLQAVVNRHDAVYADPSVADRVVTPPGTTVHESPGAWDGDDSAVRRVVLLEPRDVETVSNVVDGCDPEDGYDCVLANPHSFNRVADRAETAWCSPLAVRRSLDSSGYDVETVGYHGPRSIFQSLVGRTWEALGRPDMRDRYTHRMRDRYREGSSLGASLSCFVHLRVTGNGAGT